MVQGVPSHQRPMRIEAREWLRDANRDHIVDAVMRSIAPAVLRLRVLQLEADGKLPVLDERKRHDPKSSTLSAVRSIAWGSQFLGIDAPAIHVDKDAPHAIAAVFAKQQSLIVGAEALGGKTVGELAFLVGQHLALRLPEHELVAHYAGIEELSVCFLAALRLVLRSSVPPGGKLARAVEALAGLVAKTITEDELEELTTAAWKLETGGGKVNLNEWVASVERCAARTGLLLCGNLQTAAKLLRAQKEGASCLGAEARIDDLCSFAVSDGYLRLRQELGSAISDKKPFGGSGASDG